MDTQTVGQFRPLLNWLRVDELTICLLAAWKEQSLMRGADPELPGGS